MPNNNDVLLASGRATDKSFIIVNAPTGSTVYIVNQDNKRKDASEKNGTWTFKGCDIGTWTVYASLNGEDAEPYTIVITEEDQQFRYYVTIEYRDYLFKDGNQYEDITGGWNHSKYSPEYGGEATVEIGNSIKVTAASNNSYITFVHPVNKIALTDYTELVVTLDVVKNFYQMYLLVDDATTGNTPIASVNATNATSGQYILDISNITGSYYVGVRLNNIAVQARESEVYITEVELR